MCCRFWRIAHPLLTLAAVACCAWLVWRDFHRPSPEQQRRESERLGARADLPVRDFLGVKWLGGDYELPPGEEHCGVAILRFEDGKCLGRDRATVFSAELGGSRVVPFYVMWGPGQKGTTLLSGWPGFYARSDGDSFFAKLDGELARGYGDASLGEIRGYRVIGYAMSHRGHEGVREQIETGLAAKIKNRSAAVVLGVKPFSTREEAQKWLEASEPRDP